MAPVILLIVSTRATVRTLLVRALLVRALLVRSTLLLLAVIAHVGLLLVVVGALWRITAVLLVLRGVLLVVRRLWGRRALRRGIVRGRGVVDLVGHDERWLGRDAQEVVSAGSAVRLGERLALFLGFCGKKGREGVLQEKLRIARQW